VAFALGGFAKKESSVVLEFELAVGVVLVSKMLLFMPRPVAGVERISILGLSKSKMALEVDLA